MAYTFKEESWTNYDLTPDMSLARYISYNPLVTPTPLYLNANIKYKVTMLMTHRKWSAEWRSSQDRRYRTWLDLWDGHEWPK